MAIPKSPLRQLIDRPKAARLFVDRQEPLSLFRDAINRLDPSGLRLIVFYGLGGQGKTELCKKLVAVCAEDEELSRICVGHVDLRGRQERQPALALLWVRNALVERGGLSCHSFDIAFTHYWLETFPDQPLPNMPKRLLERVSSLGGAAGEGGADLIKDLGGSVLDGIPFVGAALKALGGFAVRKGTEAYLHYSNEALRHLYRDGERIKPFEIEMLLPYFLARDIEVHRARNPASRIAIFLDEYEGLFDAGGSTSALRQNRVDEVIFVIFSREKLPWDRIDPGWAATMEEAHHILAGIGKQDAEQFLAAIPIEDKAIRAAMISGAEAHDPLSGKTLIYPYMLDLQVDHFLGAQEAGASIAPEDFQISDTDFLAKRNILIQRFLRYCDDALERTLRRLAFARVFDKEAFAFVLEQFRTGLAADRMADVLDLSFVYPAPGENNLFVMHGLIAEALRSSIKEDDRIETHRQFARNYLTRAQKERDGLGGLRQVTWLAEAVHHIGLVSPAEMAAAFVGFADETRSFVLWPALQPLAQVVVAALLENIDAPPALLGAVYRILARATFDTAGEKEAAPLYQRAVSYHATAKSTDSRSYAECLYGLSTALQDQECAEAEVWCRQAIPVFQSLVERSPGDDDALADLANAYMRLGVICDGQNAWTDAEEAYEEAYRCLDRGHIGAPSSFFRHMQSRIWIMRTRVLHRKGVGTARQLAEQALAALESIQPVRSGTMLRRDIGIARYEICSILRGEGQLDAAEAGLRANIDLFQALVNEQPHVGARMDLSAAYRSLASIHVSRSQFEAAEAMARRCLSITQQFVEENATSGTLMELASCWQTLGLALANQDRVEEARAAYQCSCDALERINDHSSKELRKARAFALTELGVIERRLDHFDVARLFFEKADTIWMELANDLPLDLYWMDAARVVAQLQQICEVQDDPAASRYRRMVGFIGNSHLLSGEGFGLCRDSELLQDEDFRAYARDFQTNVAARNPQAMRDYFVSTISSAKLGRELLDYFEEKGGKILAVESRNVFCNTNRNGDIVIAFGQTGTPHPNLLFALIQVLAARSVLFEDGFVPYATMGSHKFVELSKVIDANSAAAVTVIVHDIGRSDLLELFCKFTDYRPLLEAHLKDLKQGESALPFRSWVTQCHVEFREIMARDTVS
jgi:tetratricopeptide (TPR) repeat protein